MDLDDQLAALAAGELDDATARAVRARAAADPGLAQRLARHEHLQELLTSWDVPALSDEASARLDARMDEALAALGDGPLTEASASAVAPSPRAATDERTARDAPSAPVADLQAARQRRSDRGTGGRASGGAIAWPSWAPAAAVAAALVAVVGTGVLVGGLPGGVGVDTMAQDDSGEETLEEGAPAEAEMSDDTADDAAGFSTARGTDVALAEGELLALVEDGLLDGEAGADTTQDTAIEEDSGGADGDAAAQDEQVASTESSAHPCLVEALERDTDPAEGWEVHLLATGTYDGQDAAFVVLRAGDQFEVLAYDPVSCDLLARDATSR